jgi:hypothetical protein
MLICAVDLPGDGKVIQVTELGLSDYCRNHRIDLERPDGSVAHFFTKVRRTWPQTIISMDCS